MRKRVVIDDGSEAYSYEPTADEERAFRADSWEADEYFEDDDREADTVEGIVAQYDEADFDDAWDDDADAKFTNAYRALLDYGVSHDEALGRLGRRTRDLAPAAVGASVRRTRGTGHARRERPPTGPYLGLGAEGEAVPLADADGPPFVAPRESGTRFYDDRSREDATAWLKANDLRLTAGGVAEEIRRALGDACLTTSDVDEAFKPGKPATARRALRDRLREALSRIYEDGQASSGRRYWMSRAIDSVVQPSHASPDVKLKMPTSSTPTSWGSSKTTVSARISSTRQMNHRHRRAHQ